MDRDADHDDEVMAAFVRAARLGHHRKLQAMVDTARKHTRSNGIDADVLTAALLSACGARRDACVAILLEAGADPNREWGVELPLERAIRSGGDNSTVIEALLDYGADINRHSQRRDGQTPLMMALDDWSVVHFFLLLRRGASVDVDDWNGQTILHRVVESQLHGHITSMITAIGRTCADPDHRDNDGRTPFALACAQRVQFRHIYDALLMIGANPAQQADHPEMRAWPSEPAMIEAARAEWLKTVPPGSPAWRRFAEAARPGAHTKSAAKQG